MKMLSALLALTIPLAAPAAADAQGMVTSADPRATEAGQSILRQGGSATDAAMAMMLALTVVEPQSSGIGGGGFLVHNDGKTGRINTIDGREKAPMAANERRWVDAAGKSLTFRQAFAGGRSVGVPGNIRLMALATKKWGKLPWKSLFAPAIALAEQGYTVTPPMANATATLVPLWSDFPAVRQQYSRDGNPLAVGTRITNPALAKTLRTLAAEGADAFYTGENARALIAAATGSSVAPSDMTVADLAAYQAKERPAVCGAYRQYRICGMGPPSAGATTVIGILTMLERFDMKKLGRNSPVAWHLIGEAMQQVYADRDRYLADADFIAVPVAGLIDRGYLQRRSQALRPDASLAAYAPGTPPGAAPRTGAPSSEVPSTTHFIATDRSGDVVSMTSTVEGPFGSQLLAGGYVLNNELTDFTFAPERDGMPVANRPQGGKRPLSSMAPTIVYLKGKPVFAVGAAGGRTIPMQVTKTLIAHLDWGLSARDALAEPVIFFDKSGLVVERGTRLEAMIPAIEKLGHKVTASRLPLKANAAQRTAKGWIGAADPRSVGTALRE
ncbi:MAG TPA: gamma-glutamyltransferase [Sphingomonas sp.]|nr:gamma-glutamyltransferase [Sphingomonas sp.]